ncbi:MAG: sigma-54 interaction domain-containing protein [Anaerovoracaceae bacterium]|jgi:arginine utilization regulatory protein
MRESEYREIIESLLELIPEGVHIVDEHGVGIFYNETMAKAEKLSAEDVIGKDMKSAYPEIELPKSTIYQALKNGVSTKNKQQDYINLYGKEITTVNSTVPVRSGGRIVAAIEVAQDITDIRTMTDTIQQLRESQITPAGKGAKIRHYTFDDIVGESPSFQAVLQRARHAADNDASVLIYGETGTGKELFAQSIHYASRRRSHPFLAQNCAALPASLLEGILFGTVRGGFTGAIDRAGLFEQANGGTLLLDEVSAMPYDLQSKLLRVLQENYIRRVGGMKDIPVDVRIIATVNEPPQQLIESGRLRRDLYYRLNVLNLSIPPLRERPDDIQIIAEKLMEKHDRSLGKELWMISDGALDRLKNYDYPGNVRELENIIVQAISMAEPSDHVLSEKLLQLPDRGMSASGRDSDRAEGEPLHDYLAREEERIIRETLSREGGNIVHTADALGMKRQTLQHKIKKYGLRPASGVARK